MARNLTILTITLAIGAVGVLTTGCGSEPSSASHFSNGAGVETPALGQGVETPSNDSPLLPALAASPPAPALDSSSSSACAAYDYTCACHLVIDLFESCDLDRPFSKHACDDGRAQQDFLEGCMEEGYSQGQCWEVLDRSIGYWLSISCSQINDNIF